MPLVKWRPVTHPEQQRYAQNASAVFMAHSRHASLSGPCECAFTCQTSPRQRFCRLQVLYPTGSARLVQADGAESPAEPSELSDASRMPCPISP